MKLVLFVLFICFTSMLSAQVHTGGGGINRPFVEPDKDLGSGHTEVQTV